MRAARKIVAGFVMGTLVLVASAAGAQSSAPAQAAAAAAASATAAAEKAEKAAQSAAVAASAAASSAMAMSVAHAASTAASSASSAAACGACGWSAPNPWALYLVPAFVLLGTLAAIAKIAESLKKTSWSLAAALSEDVAMPVWMPAVPGQNGAAGTPAEMLMDPTGKPVLAPEMHASSSRVIAMMGMMAILFLFLGFGLFAIYEFGATGQVPDSMSRVVTFLTSGLTLFAPYLVNQFASVFKPAPSGK